MELITHRFHHLFSPRIVTAVSVAVVVALFAAFPAFADTTSAPVDERLVTVHDGGTEVTIVTRATTIKDALQQAKISLSQADIVEPAVSEKLVAQSYQVNIFRARPVVVIDGNQSLRVMTAEQSPRQIAKAAGVTLYDEDTTILERVDDVLGGGGAGLKLSISRATVFTMTLYGKTFEARSQATTVAGLLREKNISLSPNDGVSPSAVSALTSGMSVSVWRNGKQTITVEEAIVKPIEEIKDAALDLGVRQVKTVGTDGKRNVTYEIDMRDGTEVSRKEIASMTTLEPVKEVVVVGTKVNLPSGSHTDWMAAAGIPQSDWQYVDYIISKESGWRFAAWNTSGSGAYGLCQSLPATKMASAGADYMTNPITQLKWCNSYAVGRYGSWADAYNFWLVKHWW